MIHIIKLVKKDIFRSNMNVVKILTVIYVKNLQLDLDISMLIL